MPQRIEKEETILAAMAQTPLLATVPESTRREWLKGFVDGGKQSGSMVRLSTYQVGEVVLREDEWGGNSFLILVSGALDVFMRDQESGLQNKVNEIRPGESFGEMALFAGVPRIATVIAAASERAAASESLILEITRQAFRQVKKESAPFIERLGQVYELRSLDTAIERIRQSTGNAFTGTQLEQLQSISSFKVFGRTHLLCAEKQPIDKVYLLNNGWVRLSRNLIGADDATGLARFESDEVDFEFVGAGNFLGFESLSTAYPALWKYSGLVMLRTEVMEIDLAKLRLKPELCEAAQRAFARFAFLDANASLAVPGTDMALVSTEEVVTTGVVEAENVLVMDMDLCIRCGNCSFACEKVHGQSRLVRRGIHIERTPPAATRGIQHLLVPEVCIHCQDPECLTGCPTGAIARMAHGQIDIQAKTCTGCTMCARLCPYNAISMISETPQPSTQVGFSLQLKSWLGLAQPIVPPPVKGNKKETSLIAAKCNLCEGTPLNLPGKRVPAYSCEENCPTGSLLRVNPREYFDEAKQRLGLVFQTPTMALGRNFHRRDPVRSWFHLAGGLLLLMTLIGSVWGWSLYGLDHRLGGLPLTLRWLTGCIGGLGILGSMAYVWRRRIYRYRAGPLRYWLLVHTYFGAIAALAIVWHGGNHGGGTLTRLLMISFDLVLLTGLFGAVSYSVIPRILTSIEGDPLLLEDLEARRAEIQRELEAPIPQSEELTQLLRAPRRDFASLRYLFRQVWRREELTELLADARRQYRAEIDRLTIDEQRLRFVACIERLATLRRLDGLIYLHRLLKLWLPPHIIVATAMLGLLIVHIIQVTIFAAR